MNGRKVMKTILVQGAVDGELDELIERLTGGVRKLINGCAFYEAVVGKTRIVVSKTGVGIINAAVSTMTALRSFMRWM